jgi:NAD(P)-dependent dehydrogenase (short-subunit alcohol dehydrogenase family)
MMSEKRVVVTGSTRGIGKGLAVEFLRSGCRVVVSSRKESAVEETVAELTVYGSENISGCVCDVTEPGSIDGLWDYAVETMGGVDIWINNAGLGSGNTFLADTSPVDIRSIVEVNLLGTLYGCRTAIAKMRPKGGIVCLMEGFGSNGMTRPEMNVYGATKRAVGYLAKGLARETRGTGVSVIALSPGMVTTDLLVGDLQDRPKDERNRLERVFSILADDVETVTPYLVSRLLAIPKNGSHIRWLTQGKVLLRFISAPWRTKRMRRKLFGK